MALDGIFLSFLKNELTDAVVNARVEKIYQPSPEELVVSMRGKEGHKKLLFSVRANSPRVQLTNITPENPAVPPMLCMLLRKHLSGARLVDIRQPGLERILFFDFDGTNEMGDAVRLTLCIEIMARHSNIILMNESGKILDSVKRVDITTSSVRQVLPGMQYQLPPAQDKLDITACAPEEILSSMLNGKNLLLPKALQQVLQGVSPLVCRELANLCHGSEKLISALGENEHQRLLFFLKRLQELTLDGKGKPIMVMDVSGKPIDFSFTEITQYGLQAITKEYSSYSELLDNFYAERDRIERTRQRSHDLLRILTNASERITRKLNSQHLELKTCADRETLKMYGDIINANLYKLNKGALFYDLEDFYHDYKTIRIPVDPALTPSQNAQKYYKEYQKARTAETMLTRLIEQGEKELEYIDTVFDSLSRADTERELAEIKEELAEQGYLKQTKNRGKVKKAAALKPISFISNDGFPILVGRNNRQNDRLTLHDAAKNDIWFHTKGIPGSHVIIVTQGQTPPPTTLEQAALLAAFHSKARESSGVAVDYTAVKNVKKPSGAKPGMVIYENYSTAYVTPNRDSIEKLREN